MFPLRISVSAAVLFCSAVYGVLPVFGQTNDPAVTPIPGGFFVQWDEKKPADVAVIQLDKKFSGTYELTFDVPKEFVNAPSAAIADERLRITVLADYWLSRGKPERAVPLYEKGLQKDPDSFLFLNNLAMLYSQSLGQHEKGLELVNRALEKNKDDTRLLDTKGLILVNSNNLKNAQPVLQRAVELSCQNPMFCMHLAYAYVRDSQDSAARRYFDPVRERLEQMKPTMGKENQAMYQSVLSALPPLIQ
ncbi:MAG: tetratricopeptide repeat protein [Planctomycetaceae bacterium]|jgi:tetratricopeptide (TPR) repeat protein|nr:tetratricopeptide repeat protein [Planctomycetaceae bacterium]